MRGEANISLGARDDQRLKKNKKYDMKCSISSSHARPTKYWTVGPVIPRVGVGII